MRECPACQRLFAEVHGVDEQTCPHCGARSPTARALLAAAPVAHARVDPVAAASLALRLYVRHYGALMLLWTPVVLASVGVNLALGAYAQSAGIALDPLAMGMDDQFRLLGIALPLSALALAVELSAWSVVAGLVLARRGLIEPGWGRALARRAPAMFGLGLVLTLGFLAGMLLLIVPFLIFLHWFAYAPAAFAEGKGVAGSFTASRAFARERRTYGFTALIVLSWLAVFALELVFASILRASLAGMGASALYADALAPPLAAWGFAPFLPLLPAAYWVLARESPAAPAAPAADARPAERFRTTKCPRCSMLIPYSATGQPVDVECPSCGHKGRVL